MILNQSEDDIDAVSNSTSFYALVSLIVIFLLIVTYGWSTMLSPVIALPYDWPDWLSPLFWLFRYVAGLAIAMVGVVLGKAVAAERIRLSLTKDPKFTNSWKAYFVVLLVISSLGTMNTLFMQTQQSGVLGDVVTETSSSLQQLKFKIDEKLSTPEYDQKRLDIDHLFNDFSKELKNPANCGFGAQANQRFHDLQQILPKLKPLALGSGACGNVDSLIESYKDTVESLKDDLPEPHLKKRYLQRVEMIESINQTITTIDDMKVKVASLDKGSALPILTSAWNTYSKILNDAELLAGVSFDLPNEIVNKNVQGMGNITQILPLLISQLNNALTYVIIFAAILFDVLLIEFFSRHLHGRIVVPEGPFEFTTPGSPKGKASNLFDDHSR